MQDPGPRILEMPDLARLRRDVFAVGVSDEETRETIREAWRRHRLLLEPHGAVGWAGLRRFLDGRAPGPEPLSVSVETAHPAKFPEEIRALVGVDPEVPPSPRWMEEEPEPALYFYRLRMGSHEQTGLAACYSVDEYDAGLVKKHEKTRRDKEDDRTRHITELRAQTGPVFLTYKARPEIDALAARPDVLGGRL